MTLKYDFVYSRRAARGVKNVGWSRGMEQENLLVSRREQSHRDLEDIAITMDHQKMPKDGISPSDLMEL